MITACAKYCSRRSQNTHH